MGTTSNLRRQWIALFYFKSPFFFNLWSRRQELNLRPSDYKSDALPTELHRHTLHTTSLNSTPLKPNEIKSLEAKMQTRYRGDL